MRICPNCLKETDREICPHDGFQTSERKNFKIRVADPLIGQVFVNRYQIEKLIGEGGMGKVYLAKQISVDRDVAIKILLSDNPNSENDIIRFQREAMTVGKLQHPNTVKLYDYGETESGGLFMVMEYIQGKTIREHIKLGRKFTVDEVSTITKQILKSLREAHEHGIVHRDLKSSNIMLTENFGEKDFVKVLDFGIAKNIFPRKEDSSLTATGFVVGTPTYMSPEQILGLQVDARSDLYSLGLIMYEMLTHRKPPKAKNRAELIDTRPDHEFLRFDHLPQTEKAKTLYALVGRSLEKMINKRPESAGTFLTMIEKVDQTDPNVVILAPQKENKPPHKKQRKKKIALFPILIIIALLGLISIKYLRRLPQAQDVAKVELPLIKLETPAPAPLVVPTLPPANNNKNDNKIDISEVLTFQTTINLSFAKDRQNLFLKTEGPRNHIIEIALLSSDGDHPAFQTQIELTADILKKENIPILIRAKLRCAFVLSLIQKTSTENNVLASGMVNLHLLDNAKIVPIDSTTTLLTKFALKQNKSEYTFRCILEPYVGMIATLKNKHGNNLWSISQSILAEEVSALVNFFSSAPPCQLEPMEQKVPTRLIPITLSLAVGELKLPTGTSLKLRIMREDRFYLPLKAENSHASNLDLTPDLDFAISNDEKIKTLRLSLILGGGPGYGVIEITHNDSLILSGIISLRTAEEDGPILINAKTTLINQSLNLADYDFFCLRQHLTEVDSQTHDGSSLTQHLARIQKEKICITRYPQKRPDPIRFGVSSKTLPKTTLLQREDFLFIPIKIDSDKHEIEFNNHLGPHWARLIVPENPHAPLLTIINLRNIITRTKGFGISPLGNLILKKIMNKDSLAQYDVECLFFQFYELQMLATSQFQISPENDTDILNSDWQMHFDMIKYQMPCKNQ